MPTMEGAASLPREKVSGIRWKHVVLAGFLSEISVTIVLLGVIAVYAFAIAPGRTNAEYQEFGNNAGYYVAPAAAALITFLFTLWVTKGLESHFIANGVLVGVVGVLFTAAFFFTARPEDRLMYGISFVLRIVSGYLGGFLSRTRSNRA